MKTYFKPKLYFSARISPDAVTENNRVASYLKNNFDVYLPHENQAATCSSNEAHERIGFDVYFKDITAMEQSDLCLLLPPYGRDCSWELGWYKGQGKPVYVYVEEQSDWLRDLMVKGGLTNVFTPSEATYKRLMVDPILKAKVIKLDSPEDLGDAVLTLYDVLKCGRILMRNC